jgi:hypothetical protein
MSMTGKIHLDNVKGFSVVTDGDVTTVNVNDCQGSVVLNLTDEMAVDLANAIQMSLGMAGVRVTASKMREIRAVDEANGRKAEKS